jgi:uncharacterized lipoprotein YddW (UPF0748 family)
MSKPGYFQGKKAIQLALRSTFAALLHAWPLHVARGAETGSRLQSGSRPRVETRRSLGVWLTTVDSNVIYDKTELIAGISFLSDHGFQRVAIPLYTGGDVYWPLDQVNNKLGIGRDSRILEADQVGAAFGYLKERGMQSVGWFEFGLMAPADASWVSNRQDYLLRNQAGETTWLEHPSLKRVWLNPAIPDVRQSLAELVADACLRYKMDYVQFDDHLGYPTEFGYDPVTLDLWRQTDYGSIHPTPRSDDRKWVEWRSQFITQLLADIHRSVRKVSPMTKISVAPNPLKFSSLRYLANWAQWIDRHLVDEIVIQVYRNDMNRFLAELLHSSVCEARVRIPVRIGILAGLKNDLPDKKLLRSQIEGAEAMGFDGVDLFFFETLKQQISEGFELAPS